MTNQFGNEPRRLDQGSNSIVRRLGRIALKAGKLIFVGLRWIALIALSALGLVLSGLKRLVRGRSSRD